MSFAAFASANGLRRMASSFKQSVKPVDVILGALAGKVGGKVIGSFLRKQLTTKDGATVQPEVGSIKEKLVMYADDIGSVVVGAGAFAVTKGAGRGPGMLVGAVGLPVVERVSSYAISKAVENKLPGFAELLPLNYGALRLDAFQSFEALRTDNSFQSFQGSDFAGADDLEEASI